MLHLHRQRRTARLTEEGFEEQRGAALALAEVGHEQAGEGDRPRAGLADGYAGREVGAGGRPAPAGEPVALVLGDDGLDLGEFPDRMPERGRVGPGEGRVAPPAGRRGDRDDPVAVVGREERSGVLVVPRSATAFLAGSGPDRGRLGVRVLGAGRDGRVRGRRVASRPRRSRTSARSWSISANRARTNARTAGVIRAASSGGIPRPTVRVMPPTSPKPPAGTRSTARGVNRYTRNPGSMPSSTSIARNHLMICPDHPLTLPARPRLPRSYRRCGRG